MITDNWNEHQWQEFGKRFIQENVLLGQTVLINDLVAYSYDNNSGLAREFSPEEMDGYYHPVGFGKWRATECIAWLRDNNVPEDEWPDDWGMWNDLTDGAQEDFDYDIDTFSDDGEWAECVLDHWREPEVNEWYVVSDWLEARLREIGHATDEQLRIMVGETGWWPVRLHGQLPSPHLLGMGGAMGGIRMRITATASRWPKRDENGEDTEEFEEPIIYLDQEDEGMDGAIAEFTIDEAATLVDTLLLAILEARNWVEEFRSSSGNTLNFHYSLRATTAHTGGIHA